MVPAQDLVVEQTFDTQSPSLETQVHVFSKKVAGLLRRKNLGQFVVAHKRVGKKVFVAVLPTLAPGDGLSSLRRRSTSEVEAEVKASTGLGRDISERERTARRECQVLKPVHSLHH